MSSSITALRRSSSTLIVTLIVVHFSVSAVVGSHLILNLRRVGRKTVLYDDNAESTTSTHITLGGPRFATGSFLGNIGAPIRMGTEWDGDNEEDEEETDHCGHELSADCRPDRGQVTPGPSEL